MTCADNRDNIPLEFTVDPLNHSRAKCSHTEGVDVIKIVCTVQMRGTAPGVIGNPAPIESADPAAAPTVKVLADAQLIFSFMINQL